MSGIHFANPQWAHLLWALVAFALLLIWLELRGGGQLARFMSAPMRERLVNSAGATRRFARIAFLALAGCFLVLALMRPQWGLQFIATPRVGAEIMVCLDVSKSMLAEDVAPNRLERAKADLRDLLTYLDGDQVGLIAFAGRAAVVSPMTPDFGFLRIVLDQTGPHSVSRGGTRLEEPIRKAIAGFGDAGDISRSIVLITDGEDHDSFPLEAAKEAAERGIRILAIGFGDEAGSEIMLTDPKTGVRGVLRDSDGQAVKSRLDGGLLRDMALQTGGAYIPAGTGVLDLDAIYAQHIAGLTRGLLDGRSRSVRNDAFQWAVLLGLLCLVAAAASTATTGPRRRHTLSWFAPLVLATLILAGSPTPSLAAESPLAEVKAAETAAPDKDTAPSPSINTEAKEKEDKPFIPRDSYNRALANLNAGDLDGAGNLFEAVRAGAATDGEARFRASYNLGWVEVKRADASLEAKPEESLTHLRRAADWFREAISLRPGHAPSRHNLELILRRALELADSLNKREEGDIEALLDAAIEAQRSFLGELRERVDLGGDDEDPNAVAQARRTFRGLASRQLEILSDGEALSERAGQEVSTLKGKSEEERKPEDAVRAVQLENLLHYLHRARERMGQARGQLRRLQAERAYRRTSAALTELKRARDQLRDPVARLDALLTDGAELAGLTGLKSAAGGGLPGREEQRPPPWLTDKYLSETQHGLTERASELHQGLSAGLSQAAEQVDVDKPAGSQSLENELFLNRLRAAEPLIGEATTEFDQALTALDTGKPRDAVKSQVAALEKLAEAREQFLDLRRLIELLYQNENRIATLIRGTPERKQEEIAEFLPTATGVHGKNVERAQRVRELITRELVAVMTKEEEAQAAPQPPATPSGPQVAAQGAGSEALKAERQRLDMADKLQITVQQRMDRAQQDLEAANNLPGESEERMAGAIQTAGASVTEALKAVEELRRLFFSVIEHLKETARQQISLNDETEGIRGLAETQGAQETGKAIGPLTPRQDGLAEKAGAIGNALSQQAEHLSPRGQEGQQPPTPAGQQPVPGGDDAERMRQAAERVATARSRMEGASGSMKGDTPDLEEIRNLQDQAVEELLQAVALLEPPQQQDHGQDQDQDQEQEQEQGGDKPQEKQRQPEQSGDPGQLLQGVRDREAQRRREKEKGRHGAYEPVEKDW